MFRETRRAGSLAGLLLRRAGYGETRSGETQLNLRLSAQFADPLWRLRRLAGEIVRFGMIGGVAFAIDATVLSGLTWLGLTPFLGRLGSIAIAIGFTWMMNRWHTFKVEAPPSWPEFGRYVAISLIGAGVNYVVFSAATLAGAPMLLALATGTGCAMGFNFVRYRALLSPRGVGPFQFSSMVTPLGSRTKICFTEVPGVAVARNRTPAASTRARAAS